MKKVDLPESKINILIVSFLTDSIDHEEFIYLQQWINASAENRKYFNNLKDSWTLSSLKKESASGLNNSWLEFKEKLDLNVEQESKETGRRINKPNYLRLAASWLLFCALGSGLTWIISNRLKNSVGNTIEISVPLGSRNSIKLPDGTRVWLNAGTTLAYNENYGRKTRTLDLTGEAYFDVAKDKSHPFIVKTAGLVVKALGTKFNIKAYPDEKTISATLEEGKIDVSLLNRNGQTQKVVLNPNQKIIYFKKIRESEIYTESIEDKANLKSVPDKDISMKLKDASILTNVQTELFTSWKDARWIIKGEPLGTLAPMLERRYNLRIVFNEEELKKYKFSGTIENETVDQLLKAMRLTAPLDYSINKDTIILTLNKNYKDEFGKIMTHKQTN